MERQTIQIKVRDGYELWLGRGLLDALGTAVRTVSRGERVAVITDSHVAPLYLDRAVKSLQEAGFRTASFVLEAGEAQKTVENVSAVWSFLAEQEWTRRDLIVALGGGVVGDLSGFAAGCYQRGISVVQVPTTLLAAVDASVGGKTAVNLNQGKNLVGVFHQPALVLCDPDCFATLSEHSVRDGMAEAIKTAIVGDAGLFSLLETGEADDVDIIDRCVRFKAKIVSVDETEQGIRVCLNLGHTFGHAIERVSRFSVSHGHAVAVGIAWMANYAAARGILSQTDAERIHAVLERNGLPTDGAWDSEQLIGAIRADKKRSGDLIRLVLPTAIGAWTTECVPLSALHAVLGLAREGMNGH